MSYNLDLIPTIYQGFLPPEVLDEVYKTADEMSHDTIIGLDWNDEESYYLLKDFILRRWGIKVSAYGQIAIKSS